MSVGRHQPFWIAAGGRRLYAALHPASAPPCPIGVVCVPPLLHEQPRSRRFVTEVASGLAARGVPCLRFDFHGSGDSSGSGDELDFASMRTDLASAVDALKARTGVGRVALLAWRGAALPVEAWLRATPPVDFAIFWEPIVDGMDWLAELERQDAGERAARPRPRPGVPRTAALDDGQLMGFAASPRLRRDLAAARIDGHRPPGVPVWAVTREAAALPIDTARAWPLPAGMPTFAGGASMEATLFLSPPLERIVDGIGSALLEQAAAGPARVVA